VKKKSLIQNETDIMFFFLSKFEEKTSPQIQLLISLETNHSSKNHIFENLKTKKISSGKLSKLERTIEILSKV